MCIPRRVVIIATSIFLLLIIAISLATSFEVRATQQKLVHISLAQAQKIETLDLRPVKANKGINGSDFDRASIFLPPTVYLSSDPTPVPEPTLKPTSSDPRPTPTSSLNHEEGLIGETKKLEPTPTSDEGYLGPIETPLPPPPPPPAHAKQLPILALTYSGASGPKHCRGSLIQKLSFPPPVSQYTNGTCISLSLSARCGVFFAGKEAGCQADLFSVDACEDTPATYINTVIFMPEERTVGGLWKSMRVKCGIKGLDAQVLDPALFKGLVKPKDSGNEA